ncbi:hypothetical protein ACFVH0_36775 [Streptomyces sp. NPDC127117]
MTRRVWPQGQATGTVRGRRSPDTWASRWRWMSDTSRAASSMAG